VDTGELEALGPLGCLIVVGDQVNHCRVISKLNIGVGRGHIVVGEQGVQEGTKHAPLSGHCIEGQHGRCVVAYPHHLGAARQEVNPFAEGGVQSQGPELSDELGGFYGVDYKSAVNEVSVLEATTVLVATFEVL
jgi:hypothetical protein